MKVYIDVVLFINLFFDFILLLSVNLLLKRRVKLKNIILGSIIGSFSILFLFISIDSFELFIYKVLISILMCLTAFDFKNIKYTFKNLLYLYIISIFLGGGLYLLNNTFSYKNIGLIFFHNGLSINIYLIIVISPILLYLYIKQNRNIKNNYNSYYKLDIYLDNKVLKVISYLDTGNKLVDPYTLKPVILLYNKDPIFDRLNYYLIPYNTISNKGFIKGYKASKIYIEGIGYRYKVIIGLINNKLNIDGADCIINNRIMEEI